MSIKGAMPPEVSGKGSAPMPARIGNYEIMGVLGRGQSATI